MDNAEKIEKIRELRDTARRERCPGYLIHCSELDDILDPPKPEERPGYIHADDLPEPGTVFEFSNGVRRKLVCVHDNRILIIFNYSAADTGGRIDPMEMSIDEWNKLNAPTVTTVHPPDKPERPVIKLLVVEDGAQVDTDYGFTVIRHPNSIAHKSLQEGLRRILESAGIDVRIEE